MKTLARFAILFPVAAALIAAPSEVTLHKDVEPILQKHCQGIQSAGRDRAILPCSLIRTRAPGPRLSAATFSPRNCRLGSPIRSTAIL